MKPVKQICFWIVGRSIAIDLHDEHGELIRPHGFDEPIMIEINATSESERCTRGWDVCVAVAQSHGLGKSAVTYDADSTEAFR